MGQIYVIDKLDNGRYNMILTYDDQQCLQFDCPVNPNLEDKFTIFWRGHVDQKTLSQSANLFRFESDKNLRTLYFFEDEMFYLPSHKVEGLPTNLETEIVGHYGDPVFLRYEFYQESAINDEIKNCRAAIWATLSSHSEMVLRDETVNEIGCFIRYKDFYSDVYLRAIDQFIRNTIAPEIAVDFYSYLSKVAVAFGKRSGVIDNPEGLTHIIDCFDEKLEFRHSIYK